MATTGHGPTSALLSDPTALRVLSTIYRARPTTRHELVAFEAMPREGLDEILQTLEQHGLIALTGDRIQPLQPDRVLASLSADVLTREREELAELADVTARMSALTRDWELGVSGDSASSWAEIVHGHEAQWHAWGRYASTHPPAQPINLYPDLSVLKAVILPTLSDEELAVVSRGTRAVFPASVLSNDADRVFLDRLAGAGTQVRLVEAVPSWLYADRGILCALPLVWAEHPPTSIVIIQQPSIVEAVWRLAESVWTSGATYPSANEGWTPILQLLARGMSDAAIADTLELSLRTVQRRVTEAMEHYRVRSRFELGAAWATEVTRERPRASS
jgi:hypothetical protein